MCENSLSIEEGNEGVGMVKYSVSVLETRKRGAENERRKEKVMCDEGEREQDIPYLMLSIN